MDRNSRTSLVVESQLLVGQLEVESKQLPVTRFSVWTSSRCWRTVKLPVRRRLDDTARWPSRSSGKSARILVYVLTSASRSTLLQMATKQVGISIIASRSHQKFLTLRHWLSLSLRLPIDFAFATVRRAAPPRRGFILVPRSDVFLALALLLLLNLGFLPCSLFLLLPPLVGCIVQTLVWMGKQTLFQLHRQLLNGNFSYLFLPVSPLQAEDPVWRAPSPLQAWRDSRWHRRATSSDRLGSAAHPKSRHVASAALPAASVARHGRSRTRRSQRHAREPLQMMKKKKNGRTINYVSWKALQTES